MPRRVYAAEVEIDAPVDAVWEVLVDLDGYADWNPFTPSMRSTLRVDAPIDMRVRMAKLGLTLRQRETVRAVDPPRRLVWGVDMMGGLVRAERLQTLTALDGDRTRYRTVNTIEGPLGPLVFLLFGPSIQAGFDGVAEALAARVSAGR